MFAQETLHERVVCLWGAVCQLEDLLTFVSLLTKSPVEEFSTSNELDSRRTICLTTEYTSVAVIKFRHVVEL